MKQSRILELAGLHDSAKKMLLREENAALAVGDSVSYTGRSTQGKNATMAGKVKKIVVSKGPTQKGQSFAQVTWDNYEETPQKSDIVKGSAIGVQDDGEYFTTHWMKKTG